MFDQTSENSKQRDAFDRVLDDYGEADRHKGAKKRKLPLTQLHTEPGVFQHRESIPEAQWEVDLHLTKLLAAIHREPGHVLEPITVWKCGGRWIVIDGHYRLEAYAQYAREMGRPLGRYMVPCMVFSGDPLAAWDYSVIANKKVTLPLSSTERSNAAWKRVCMSRVGGKWITSKAEIVRLGIVGSNTVSRMRRALLAIIEQDLSPGGDPMGLSWAEAESLYRGERVNDFQFDGCDIDPMVQDWADRLTRVFGKELWRSPERFLQAVELYSPKLAGDLADYYSDREEDF